MKPSPDDELIPTVEPTREELEIATIRASSRLMADTFTTQLGLAAELYPDVLQNAFAKVFDLSAIQENNKNLIKQMADQWKKLAELREEIQFLSDKVKSLIGDIDNAMFNWEQGIAGE